MLPFLLIALFVTIGCLPLMLTSKGRTRVAMLRMKVVLKQFTKKKKGFLVRHVYCPLPSNGKEVEFSHVLITQGGIFIITIMNKEGKISGSKDANKWNQFIKKGKVNNKFDNPLLLDAKRINTVSNILNINKNIGSLIVFVKGNIKDVDAPVLTIRKLYKTLKGKLKTKEKYFTKSEINNYAKLLSEYKDEQYTKYVQENKCPKCQKPLKAIKNKESYLICCSDSKCKYKVKVK